MGSRLVMWTLGVGLLGVVLLALSLVPLTTTGSVVAYAPEQADLLDINTATDRKSTRLNSSHSRASRMPSSA